MNNKISKMIENKKSEYQSKQDELASIEEQFRAESVKVEEQKAYLGKARREELEFLDQIKETVSKLDKAKEDFSVIDFDKIIDKVNKEYDNDILDWDNSLEEKYNGLIAGVDGKVAEHAEKELEGPFTDDMFPETPFAPGQIIGPNGENIPEDQVFDNQTVDVVAPQEEVNELENQVPDFSEVQVAEDAALDNQTIDVVAPQEEKSELENQVPVDDASEEVTANTEFENPVNASLQDDTQANPTFGLDSNTNVITPEVSGDAVPSNEEQPLDFNNAADLVPSDSTSILVNNQDNGIETSEPIQVVGVEPYEKKEEVVQDNVPTTDELHTPTEADLGKTTEVVNAAPGTDVFVGSLPSVLAQVDNSQPVETQENAQDFFAPEYQTDFSQMVENAPEAVEQTQASNVEVSSSNPEINPDQVFGVPTDLNQEKGLVRELTR